MLALRDAGLASTSLRYSYAVGSPYKAGPKKTAAEKRLHPRTPLPPDKYVWRNDTLRLMFPGRSHSVSMFWGLRAGTSTC